MRLEKRGPSIPWLAIVKPLSVILMVAAAVAIPSWFYHKHGRKLPLKVLVSAGRYVVAAGAEVDLRGHLFPDNPEVRLTWKGPGLVGRTDRSIRWRAPRKPGVYEVELFARRSAGRAEDSISIRVVPKEPADYPRSVPAAPDPPPPGLPACELSRPMPELVVHRADSSGAGLCAGERVVIEVKTEDAQCWIGAQRRGCMAELRLPASAPSLMVTAQVYPRKKRCRLQVSKALAIGSCRLPGPHRLLFADFHWQLSAPSLFRLAAKPPRGQLAKRPTEYRWRLDGQPVHVERVPHLMFKAKTRAAYHLMRLTLKQGDETVSTIRLLSDRSVM